MKLSEKIALFHIYSKKWLVFNWVGFPIFGRDGWKTRAKMRKIPNFPVLKGVIFLICPWNIRTHPLHFSDDQFSPLIRKIDKKIERNCTLDQFYTVPSTFSLSLPKVLGQVCHFVITLYRTWC